MDFLEKHFLLIFNIALAIIGAAFIGHELSQVNHDRHVRLMSEKLNKCNQIIAGASE